MKNLRIFPLALTIALLALQACQLNTPHPGEDDPAITAQLKSSATFHYHDGQSSTAREVVLSRFSDGSVTVQRTDVPLNQATNLVRFVTLDTDPIPPNSTAEAVYNSGSSAWFIPFGSGNAERLLATGDQVEITCFCTTVNTSPGPMGSCSLGEVNFSGQSWDCIPDMWCVGECAVQIVFSRKERTEPGITLKATQITFQ